MKTIFVISVGAAIAGMAVSHYWRDHFTIRPKFRTLPVMRGDLFIGVTASGTIEPVEIIDVGAQIIGSIKSFGPDPDRAGKTIDYRSRVKEGAVLAQLDDLPHRAEMDKAGANLQLADAELGGHRVRLNQAERVFNRAQQLRMRGGPKGAISDADYEKAEAEYEIAQTEVAVAEARLKQADIAKKQAEINLAYTVIRSPVDGVVIDRRVNVGQTVVSGMTTPSLFLLAKDLSHMLVWAAVNEADIGDIYVGQTVAFSVDAHHGRTFTGTVSQIRLNASLQQNVVTYGVIVDVENTDGMLLPYMTAKLQFEVDHRTNVVLVPNQALRWKPTWSQISPAARYGLVPPRDNELRQGEHDDRTGEEAEPKMDLATPTVWTVAEDGLVCPVPVTIGLSDGMVTEILSGDVKPGDTLVVNIVRKTEADFVSSFVSRVTDSSQ